MESAVSPVVLPVGRVAVPVRVSTLVARCELVKQNIDLLTHEQSRLYDSFEIRSGNGNKAIL